MELIYFPAFLILAAGLVVWLFKRGTQGDSSRRSTRSTRSSATVSTSQPRPVQGNKARLQSGQGTESPGDIWRRKRERATKSSFSGPATTGVYQATYANPSANQVGSQPNDRVADQEVSEAELQGLDEYLARREAEEKAKLAEEARQEDSAGLSMTAMKFESATEEPASEEKPARKGGGFKP